MNHLRMVILLALAPLLGAASKCQPHVSPDAGPTPVVSSQPIPPAPPPPPAAYGGSPSTGGAAATGGQPSPAVIGLSCLSGDKLAADDTAALPLFIGGRWNNNANELKLRCYCISPYPGGTVRAHYAIFIHFGPPS